MMTVTHLHLPSAARTDQLIVIYVSFRSKLRMNQTTARHSPALTFNIQSESGTNAAEFTD